MTDRTDHRAEAERLLADAYEWGKQAEEPTPEVGELTCLAYAAVHALLAIHDTLTATDRYATNEERQREIIADYAGQPVCGWCGRDAQGREWPNCSDLAKDGIDRKKAHDATCERYWGHGQDWVCDECEAEMREGQMDDAWQSRDWETVSRLQDEEWQRKAGPDPLDENDHRDRMGDEGSIWTHRAGLWCLKSCSCHEGSWNLDQINGFYGPLTFAPEVAPDPLDEDDHRDRLDREGVRLIRNGQRHWHRPVFTDCAADCGTSLAYWDHLFGPLTFAPDVVEPDPLDEDDHRDRVDRDGDRLTRHGVRHWHYWDVECACDGSSPESLAYFDYAYGPLAFAPDTAQDATGGDLSASEGESGAVEWG